MKHLLIALTILIGISTSHAQTTVEYSTPFDEPEYGWRKVLQLSNGNTFFFNYIGKDGINVTVYDKSRKSIAERNIVGDKWIPKEIKLTKIAGLYEIGGYPVLFIQQVIKRTPKLFRLIFNPETGMIVSEEQVSILQKFHAGMEYARSWGGLEEPAFHIEKSKKSDDYAIINFNSITSESDERIQVTHYTANGKIHTVKQKAYYESQGFKYVNYIASYVNDKSVHICAYGYNTRKSGGKDSRIIVSKLSKEAKGFTHKKMEFSDDFNDTRGILELNEGSGILQLFTITFLKKKGNKSTYLPLITYIDPQSLFIVKVVPLKSEYASAQVKERFKQKKPFAGMPQHMIINKDYSTTIVQEEMSKTQDLHGSRLVTLETVLGNIGITQIDPSGKETIGYAAKKTQKAIGDVSVFNLWDRERGVWVLQQSYARGNNTPFFSFDYVNTTSGKYLIYNDYPENFYKKDDGKMKTVAAASNMNSVYYELKNGFFVKHFLFAAPKDDNDLKFANIASAHFRDETNTYATLMVERNGRKKEAHIAWVKFK